MKLITDSREQDPLAFSACVGVEYVVEALGVGDYAASYVIGGRVVESHAVIERKSIGDLFSSYTSGYARERDKFFRARAAGREFILAVEGSVETVLNGHTYVKGGEVRRAKKDGMTMVRQLFSCAHKYGIEVWFCESRRIMALMVQEYFLAEERMLKQAEETL